MKRIISKGRLTEEAHHIVAGHVRPGDVMIDATAGNGNDSVFLAEHVEGEGKVFCFDVQEDACRETERRLGQIVGQVVASTEVHCCGHEEMAARVTSGVGVVMFNLGYLPGGDHAITTQPESTLAGIEVALSLLRPGGIVTVLCYVGHPGGAAEGEAVLGFCGSLDAAQFAVLRYDSKGAREDAPFLLVIEKVEGSL